MGGKRLLRCSNPTTNLALARSPLNCAPKCPIPSRHFQGPWPLPRTPCSDAWPPFQWRIFPQYPTWTSLGTTWGHFLLSICYLGEETTVLVPHSAQVLVESSGRSRWAGEGGQGVTHMISLLPPCCWGVLVALAWVPSRAAERLGTAHACWEHSTLPLRAQGLTHLGHRAGHAQGQEQRMVIRRIWKKPMWQRDSSSFCFSCEESPVLPGHVGLGSQGQPWWRSCCLASSLNSWF